MKTTMIGVVKLWMNNLPVGAMSREYMDEMCKVLLEIDNNPNIHGVILAASPKISERGIFGAGLDIKVIVRNDESELHAYFDAFLRYAAAFHSFSKPIIAEICGNAVAGMCGCVAGCVCVYL